jgi:phage baseplate assembly protein W
MADNREDLFGDDIRVAERAHGFDMVAGAGGDLEKAEGAANIEQALTLRLLVRRGELAPLGWPTYGSRLHELIGEPNNSRTRAMLMAYARTAILDDPRVVGVTSLQALPVERDLVRLMIEIELIATATPLNLVFTVQLGVA